MSELLKALQLAMAPNQAMAEEDPDLPGFPTDPKGEHHYQTTDPIKGTGFLDALMRLFRDKVRKDPSAESKTIPTPTASPTPFAARTPQQ